ncbi:Tm-1-like ATP-binding domain-containing protein [Succinispira mobilis]|uniref:Tm-1-like ATP-binding domain-containing protein n=1 Tax=Succinispira mobilis TaxID=78120 RepID=UPI00037186CF|nr:Tm-1-like ATP-binding domain-containing protein [Succinispira mobilis]
MPKKLVIVGTLDTKGVEFKFIRDIANREGVQTLVINTGIVGEPYFKPDYSSEQVAEYAGETLENLRQRADRGYAIGAIMQGAAKLVLELYAQGKVAGVISLGGSAGTTIAAHVMQALPIGLPKLIVSTVASGDTRPYVKEKDITMMYSVVDISGINSISNKILTNATYAILGMLKAKYQDLKTQKPLIAASMFGVTTPCVTVARDYLESKGYEVLVFHATGSGGMAMESLIQAGFIKGVLDVTTTELADELVGGVLTAGPERLEMAAKKGIPQVVSVGALDMVNFGPIETVPEKFQGRNLYKHNATITLMRTTLEENQALGKIIAEKLNKTTGKTAVYLPLKGVSLIDTAGQVFYGPQEDQMLFKTLKNNLNLDLVEVQELDMEINDPEFALAMAKKLVAMIEGK